MKQLTLPGVNINRIPPSLKMGVPPFSITKKPITQSTGERQPVMMDIECYSNYFLVQFYKPSDGKYYSVEITDNTTSDFTRIREILANYEIITFNGNSYDIPMLKYALSGANCKQLHNASNKIIGGMSPYQFAQHFRTKHVEINHIDLIELCIGQSSLKIYGGRLHCHTMQDLPYAPDKPLDLEQMKDIKEYCKNDLQVTHLIFQELTPQINLRRTMSRQYGVDLRSKSDAQIAEEVIGSKIRQVSGRITKRPIEPGHFYYEKPDFIQFPHMTVELQRAIDIVTKQAFTINNEGRPEMPKDLLTLKITIGKTTYQMGMGGLHSTESYMYHVSD